MRLERLEVTGFGGLRNRTVEFHPRLTLVVGDNESGKSTLHRAVRAALYGIDAGGQGRPVERSDWARWAPWSAGQYALALAYRLDDGRRIRVARRLDSREQGVQVLELGGSDLTDEVRSGRAVSPGSFHLGIDEAVFCATAWLGEEALRLGAPDAALARSEVLQEAIERLADTRQGITATEAIGRLREAIERVGSERRASSPLGVAARRLRELEHDLDEARRRVAALTMEEQRLRDLERDAAASREAALTAERAWLAARIAVVAARLNRRALAVEEVGLAQAGADRLRRYAAFPLELEERAAALGGELSHALLNAAEARAHWEAAREPLQTVRRRRSEIAEGLTAIAAVELDDATVEAAQRLHGELTATAAAASRLDEAAADRRVAALRSEIAGTGMGALPVGSAEPVAALLAAAQRRHHQGAWLATAAALGGIAAAASALLLSRHLVNPAAIAALLGAACVAACCFGFRRSRRQAAAAALQIAELERLAGVGARDVELAAARVPALQSLHAALLSEEARAAGTRAEIGAVHLAATALADRCAALVERAGHAPVRGPAGATTAALLESARASLAGFERAVTARRRRADLEAEDRAHAAEEAGLQRCADEAERCSRVAAALQDRLGQLLGSVGLDPLATPTEAAAAVREACEARRAHDAALRAAVTARQQATTLGDDVLLERALAQFAEQLREHGGDPDAARTMAPPDEAELHRLETGAQRATQRAAAVSAQARELRARLTGLLDTAPEVADLENERDACRAARDRAARQLAALRRAVALIEDASRSSHRDLAPQLAERVASRLSTLTDGRYETVNVDTEHFAVSLLSRERPDMVPLELLSHGTRDQVSLLLRIALCEVLSGSGEAIPLLLDEPTVTSDPSRRELLLEFLHRLSETNQVVMSTSDPSAVEAARRAGADDYAVVHLGAEPVAEVAGRHSARVRVL